MAGRYFDDFQEGEIISHGLHRTVTETDNLLITTLTHNTQPLHLDAQYASQTEFGKIVVNGIFTFGLMVGLSVNDTTAGTLVANLGYDELTMPKPVFVGDTLRSETKIISRRISNSRPDACIVVFEHRMFNQKNDVVCQCKRTAMLLRVKK